MVPKRFVGAEVLSPVSVFPVHVCSLANVIHWLLRPVMDGSRWQPLRPLSMFVLCNDRCRTSRTFRRLLSFLGCCTSTKTLDTSMLRCSDWFYLICGGPTNPVR